MSVTTAPALDIQHVTVRFGGVTALNDLSFQVRSGGRHGILGPNGSGKTTLFNAITGFVKPAEGRVLLHGEEILGMPPHRRTRLGLARTFQITSLFPSLTARENVRLAALARLGHHREVFRPAESDEGATALAERMLADLGLSRLADRIVLGLGYGEQRQIEIAVTLATDPKILLLDEPTAGLSAAETETVTGLIQTLPQELTIVLIEHDLGVVFDLTDHLTVLQNGERIADGPSAAVREDPVVKAVYLGT
jgi:ABC-type branched-subunit amino acid transport system ATPase component